MPRNLAASIGSRLARKTGRCAARSAAGGSPSPIRTIASARAKPVPDRFAQRPGRYQAAVAEPVFGVDDEERQVLRDPRVLKPVIEHDDLGAGRRGGAAPGGPVTRDPARPASRQQQRLVADGKSIVTGRIDPHRPGEPPAIAACNRMYRDVLACR